MSFTVTGLNAVGAVQVDCNTALDAVDESVQLLLCGYVDVLIADDAGREYTPAEFTRAFG